MSGSRFTGTLWDSIADVYAAILTHPFVTGLTDGSLPEDAFRFYVVQDSHYLREYARALALLAARAPSAPEILMFSRHAGEAIEVERSLHAGFFSDFGLSLSDVAEEPVAPTTLAYTSYLLSACHGGSFAEALGAVLPCYWIYRKVGTELSARGSPNPRYRRWIETYGGEEYGAAVEAVLELTDRVGHDLGGSERALVRERFRQTSRYEWMFWDMGIRRETWPI